MRHLMILALALTACGEAKDSTPTVPASEIFTAKHAHTLQFGAEDNSENIKLLPNGEKAILVASKARKITLLAVGDTLTELQSVTLLPNLSDESELTHIDINAAGEFAVITHTLPVSENDAVVDCKGELIFIDVRPGEDFGKILKQIPVGPMPDAVDLSDDGRWIVTADEVDYNDGKCPVAEVTGSVTVIELPDGDPAQAVQRARIVMDTTTDGDRREPEQVSIAPDNTHVAVTLQDTHEVLFFTLADAVAKGGDIPVADLTITRYPNRSDGAEPWPDGVHRFVDASGTPWFVAAGEFNDTFAFFSLEGAFKSQVEIQQSDLPDTLPRNLEDWSKAPFRPDTVAPFTANGHSYLAFSLKHAGAVGIWQVDDLSTVRVSAVVKVGQDDGGTPTSESTLGTEGISAGPGGVIVTANEKASSASLVIPTL